MAENMWERRDVRRWNIKDAMNVSLSEILHMTLPERAELGQYLQNQLRKRYEQFSRARTKGYALTKLEDEYRPVAELTGIDLLTPIVEPGKRFNMISADYYRLRNPNNRLLGYITDLQDFFKSRSSTVRGWREIGREQDNRLFGEQYKTGRRAGQWYGAKYHLTDEQRTMFWRLYDELYKADWSGINNYSSESQRQVAAFFIKGNFDPNEDIQKAVALWKARRETTPESFALDENASGPFGRENESVKEWNEQNKPSTMEKIKKWFLS